MDTQEPRSGAVRPGADGWPVPLRTGELAAMLNAEFTGHSDYDGVELQWIDDERGTGMLAFLTRVGTGLVDYYPQRVAAGRGTDPTAYRKATGT